MPKYTDLAMEARELWQESAQETTELPGVKARQWKEQNIDMTTVEILDDTGAQALGKPKGSYVTLQWENKQLHDPDVFAHLAELLGRQISRMLPKQGSVLVAGLGNSAVTPDAIGPRSVEHLVVSSHLAERFPQLRPLSAIAPGVLGTTGLESVQIVRGVVENAKIGCVIVVDALASRSLERVCTTVQLSDSGLAPGSGIGNHRAVFDSHTLGVPVLAVGIPTVVETYTLLQDVLGENTEKIEKNQMFCDRKMIVTTRDIDAKIRQLSKLLGYGISLGVHRQMTFADISAFTE